MAPQRGLTLFMGWLFVLLINSQVPSVGCQDTSEVMPLNCTSNDTQSLYAEVKKALWSNEVRPVKHPSEVLTVKVGISITGILGMDAKEQVLTLFIIRTLDWTVPFLTWDNTTCGFENISYPASALWLPSIQIAEDIDKNRKHDELYVQLNYTGGVHHAEPRSVAVTCEMDIYKFPFDIQNCLLTFHSYLHEENELKLNSKSATFIFNSSVRSDSGWGFLNVTDHISTINLTSKRYFSSITYRITFKREASIYVVSLLVPSCFLSLLDLFSFFLPLQTVDRSAFKMTLIMGYTVFLLFTNDLLPDSAANTPLINIFFSLSLALMVTSLLETMFIVNLNNNSTYYPRVPRWLHILVLDYLACLLFMSPKPPAAPVTATLNPHAKVMQDLSGEAMTRSKAGEMERMEGAAVVDELKKLARDVLTIRLWMEEHLRPKQNDWKLIMNVIDRLLFMLYVLFVIVTYSTIIALWVRY